MDKKLLLRLRMYLVISSVLLGIVLFEALSGRVSFLLAMIGLIIGVTIGVVAARIFLLSWHHDAKKIISQLDIIGGVILALYIVFAIFRSKNIGLLSFFEAKLIRIQVYAPSSLTINANQ